MSVLIIVIFTRRTSARSRSAKCYPKPFDRHAIVEVDKSHPFRSQLIFAPFFQRDFSRMSLDSVRAFLAAKAPEIVVIELEKSTATMTLAAEGHGVEPAQIAKTLSLRVGDQNLLVVTRGDARLDNKKAKVAFGGKVRMLSAEEVVAVTGHPIGGVCPFGLVTPLPVYCDVSL